MRKHIVLSILVALLFNSLGTLFTANTILTNAQNYVDEDSVLICTGSTYKWISLSAFELTGKVKFVDAPEDAPDNLHEIKCIYAFLADHNPDTLWPFAPTPLILPVNSNTAISYFSALYATSKHQLALSRAPPLIS
ncbi:MAG: hypothetical protein JKY14_11125 [Paraglaciecola sp.]|nr:hypothetical protein [Paraglaciecola sp.]